MTNKINPLQWPKMFVLCLIRFYRYIISPALPHSCRFTPTCSRYALQAIEHYGLLKGLWISVKRIARCHPFCSGGYDPLP